jgi:hypothetical protein
MGESFSPVILLDGIAIVLAVSKACTLFSWQSLPKPRPPLRQEIGHGGRRTARGLAVSEPPSLSCRRPTCDPTTTGRDSHRATPAMTCLDP